MSLLQQYLLLYYRAITTFGSLVLQKSSTELVFFLLNAHTMVEMEGKHL